MPGFRDPRGWVKEIRGDTVSRVFSKEGFEDYSSVVTSEWFRSAVSAGHLIESRVRSVSAREILAPRIQAVTMPQEWTSVHLNLAGQNQLYLAASGLRDGSITKDASPYNVLFQGMVPTHVDLGSFENFRDGDLWSGYSSFVRFFLFPLYFASASRLSVSSLLKAFPNGFDPNDVQGLISRRMQFTSGMWKFWWPLEIEQWSRKRGASPLATSQRDESALHRASLSTKSIVRQQIHSLERQLGAMTSKKMNGVWDSYSTRNHYSAERIQKKEAVVEGVLKACKPKTVLDIGANDGKFSELAAVNGAKVIALEADVAVAEGLARRLNDDSRLREVIQVAVGDYIDHEFSGPSLLPHQARISRGERFRSDLVFFLAVAHHSIISQGFPPETVVEALSKYGQRVLVEFPTRPDPMVEYLLSQKKYPAEFAERYSFDIFLATAKESFEIEEVWEDSLRPMALLNLKNSR